MGYGDMTSLVAGRRVADEVLRVVGHVAGAGHWREEGVEGCKEQRQAEGGPAER